MKKNDLLKKDDMIVRVLDIPMGKNYNLSKKGTKVPLCPPDKERAIIGRD